VKAQQEKSAEGFFSAMVPVLTHLSNHSLIDSCRQKQGVEHKTLLHKSQATLAPVMVTTQQQQPTLGEH
jgi:hypothetical protein